MMGRPAVLALSGVLLLGTLLRLLPVGWYLYWGADFGEYYAVTLHLLDEGHPPMPYGGWGVAYPDFPGMEVLVAGAGMAGAPLEASLLILPPLLGALSILGVFLLTRAVVGRDGPALLAAAFIAVGMPHVYPTSHGIPGTVGDLLFVASLLLLLHARRDRRWLPLLILVVLAAVVVHHLTTYFIILVLSFVLLARIAVVRRQDWRPLATDVGLLMAVLCLTALYWYGYATTFREEVLTDDHRLPLWTSAVGFLMPPVILALTWWVRPRLPWTYRPAYPRWSLSRAVLILGALAAVVYLASVAFVPIPGTSVRIPPSQALLFIPLLGLSTLAAVGRRLADLLPGGLTATAVLLALFASMGLGLIISPRALIPYRHVEILMVPAAVLVGLGALRLWTRWDRRSPRAVLVLTTAGLLVAAAMGSYPPREALAGFFEGYPPESLNPAFWLSERSHPEGVVASDHRASSIIFGFGSRNATWDLIDATLHASDFEGARGDMALVDLPIGCRRVDYVQLDSDVLEGAMLFPWDPARPLSPEARAKFQGSPYMKVYDDGYSQVYWVNWGLAGHPRPDEGDLECLQGAPPGG
jgi:hypothetical protein